MPPGPPRQITITAYLIKEERGTPLPIHSNRKYLKHKNLTLRNGCKCELYVRRMSPHPPRWGVFLEDHVNAEFLGENHAAGAVLFVPVDKRIFAVTFGQSGRFILDQDSWEERYGLLAVLNSIDQDQIKTIDKSTFDALTTHSRVQSSKEASPQEFGFDVEQDLVRAVTGTPNDRSLGDRLTGMDALRSSVRITLEDLPALLKKHLDQSGASYYKKTFPWVDHISEIKGSSLQDVLNNKMVEDIRSEKLDRCWFAVPDIIDWSEVDGFRFGLMAKNAKYHDLHLPDFIDEFKDLSGSVSKINLTVFKNRSVRCIGDDEQIIRKWSLYNCLYCEIDHDGQMYLLSSGKWYRVDRNFVDDVNKYFAQLPRYSVNLPHYDDSSEGSYNERVCSENPQTLALMDKRLIRYGGPRSGIEFCDVYTNSKDIIHVKRYGQSKVFSHFFAQGAVSGELFHTQAAFRRIVNETLPDTHKILDPRKVPDRDEYQVVFAIVSDTKATALTIPFFSRLNLRAACNRLIGYGYRVAISKIPVNEMRRKLKRY